MAEALISRGLAFRIRHRQDDDNRSSQYDALMMAEQKAQKAEKGCFSKNLPPTLRVSELDGTKARASFAFLKGTYPIVFFGTTWTHVTLIFLKENDWMPLLILFFLDPG